MTPDQALLTGSLVGVLMKEENRLGPISMEVDSDGNYQNYFYIKRPSGRYRIIVEAPGDHEETIEI